MLKIDLSKNAISDRGRSLAFIRPFWAEIKLGKPYYLLCALLGGLNVSQSDTKHWPIDSSLQSKDLIREI